MKLSDALERLADIGYPFYQEEGGDIRDTADVVDEIRESGSDREVTFRETRQSKVALEEQGETIGHAFIAPDHLEGSDRTAWTERR